MVHTIYGSRILDPSCSSIERHDQHRQFMLGKHDERYREVLRKVVSGRDVVEIGCSVFGGLAKMILDMGCNSYTGIDFSIGDNTQMCHPLDSRGMPDYTIPELPCIIDPKKLIENSKVEYIFGIDATSYLKRRKSNSVVTVSTGFFHDWIHLLDSSGNYDSLKENYIVNLIEEIARVTIVGKNVGFHDLMTDSNETYVLCSGGEMFEPLSKRNYWELISHEYILKSFAHETYSAFLKKDQFHLNGKKFREIFEKISSVELVPFDLESKEEIMPIHEVQSKYWVLHKKSA